MTGSHCRRGRCLGSGLRWGWTEGSEHKVGVRGRGGQGARGRRAQGPVGLAGQGEIAVKGPAGLEALQAVWSLSPLLHLAAVTRCEGAGVLHSSERAGRSPTRLWAVVLPSPVLGTIPRQGVLGGAWGA